MRNIAVDINKHEGMEWFYTICYYGGVAKKADPSVWSMLNARLARPFLSDLFPDLCPEHHVGNSVYEQLREHSQ